MFIYLLIYLFMKCKRYNNTNNKISEFILKTPQTNDNDNAVISEFYTAAAHYCSCRRRHSHTQAEEHCYRM